jgi:hypothetical protein
MAGVDASEAEARALMALRKWGDPCSSWRQDRAYPGTVSNAFGVVDEQGTAIPGLVVEFEVYRAPRTRQERYTFTLRRFEMGSLARIYQQEVNTRPGLRESDHAWSHEHIGTLRVSADLVWSSLSFDVAVQRFCRQCNLTLERPLEEIDALELR